jgi:hypothetical protein
MLPASLQRIKIGIWDIPTQRKRIYKQACHQKVLVVFVAFIMSSHTLPFRFLVCPKKESALP